MDAVADREFTFTDRDFHRVCGLIRERAGIALSPGKRDMVYSRVVRRVRARGCASFTDYLDRLAAGDDAAEWQQFTNALTTNLTAFFREAHHFGVLERLLRERRAQAPLSVWCCAASTGEEPYSIAMTACEAFDSPSPPVRVLATDIDTNVLATAEAGEYPIERIETIGEARRKRFFLRGTGPNAGRCRVTPALRRLVEFGSVNLIDDAAAMPAGRFDAIFCRNVMIYFDKETQYDVLRRLQSRLAPGGLFFAGHSENLLHAHDLFRPCGGTVYRSAADAGARA
ncbi:CheR family methyltransferase [Tahibacter soli]|uniref:Chemotaxis protein methyltransferase n=1 Tax=Tahibacter soli TaxID=2983605 RepID=A0A9X3YIC2_9GAMM|nr:CheR family methyltransferase [Tahibacter soli]MDC8012891.1 chemotaxis protein CheR [Tahibacter soli]